MLSLQKNKISKNINLKENLIFFIGYSAINFDEIKNHAKFMKRIITPKYNFDTLKGSKLIKDYFFEKSINKNLTYIETDYLIPKENSNYYKIMIIGFILSLLIFLLRVILDFNKKLNDS